MKIVLDNGIILDDDYGMCKDILEYAQSRGLKNIRVFVTFGRDNPSRPISYILVDGEKVIFENPRVEDVCVHIDILSLSG